MTAKERLQSDLQAAADAAAKARCEVASGRVVDLGSLELLANRLGTTSAELNGQDTEELQQGILLLVAELDELRELVRSEHETLRTQLEGTGTRRSAAAAYGQMPPRRR